MPRRLTLRQVEAFKAVIESGSISTAAELLHVSQPAISKLIAHFEADTNLQLFDRLTGRLVPTASGMRLYEKVDRIFAGVRQVESAVDAIRREEQGQLAIGVMPALSGSFIQRAMKRFLMDHPNVFCTVQTRSSQWIVDFLATRKLDIGLIRSSIDNPHVTLEPLMEHPLVCIVPPDHPLAAKSQIEAADLEQVPFVAFHPDASTGHLVERMFETRGIKPKIVLVASVAPTVCEFVAAGLGVSLVHPLMVSGLEEHLAVRRFHPETMSSFQLCRGLDIRNIKLVDAFAQAVRSTAAHISRSILAES